MTFMKLSTEISAGDTDKVEDEDFDIKGVNHLLPLLQHTQLSSILFFSDGASWCTNLRCFLIGALFAYTDRHCE